MRITESQLRRIIKEETRRAVLNEVFEGDARSKLATALNGFERSYVALESMLEGLKIEGISANEAIQTAQDVCRYSTGAVTSMEVFKTWPKR